MNYLTELAKYIEALLFWKGEPMSIQDLSQILGVDDEKIKNAVEDLKNTFNDRGLCIMENGDQIMLGTSPTCSELIEKLTKEELSKDLGKASLETLSIILYKGPLKRSEIDYIRGVNSTFIIRNLLIRGLIKKEPSAHDQRVSVYSVSFELLSYLGIKRAQDLPDFKKVQDEIRAFNTRASENSPDKSTDPLPKHEA